MRASRNSRPGLWRAALAIAAAISPLAAAAQQVGPPIPLIPPSATAPGTPTPAPAPVASEQLGAPAAGWNAEVTPPADALPPDFWDGTPRAVAELLLANLPDTLSPTLQSLVRRLLLSPSAAPKGPDMPDRTLPALRAAALLRLGEIDAARTVVAAVPQAQRGPAATIGVAADMVAGDLDHACDTVRDRIHRDQDVRWQRALIGCQALTDKIDEARLGLQLLAEEKAPQDEMLAIALDALGGQPAPATIQRLQEPDPLVLRLLIAAHRQLAPVLVGSLPAELALTVALDPAAPAATRLAAATRAARLGALPADRLRALYVKLAADGKPDSGPGREDARRFAAIAQAGTAVDRLARIIAFAERFGKAGAGGFAFAARLVAPLLHEIEPDPSLGGSAAAAARLLLGAGDAGGARRWAAFASGAQGERLRFLLRLAGGGGALPTAADKSALARLPLALALDDALGRSIAAADWLRLPPGAWNGPVAAAAPQAAWLDLAAAARGKRIGETVLAAVLVAAPTGTLSRDPIVLDAAISSLRRVGLDRDARRLAVEAALAAGF